MKPTEDAENENQADSADLNETAGMIRPLQELIDIVLREWARSNLESSKKCDAVAESIERLNKKVDSFALDKSEIARFIEENAKLSSENEELSQKASRLQSSIDVQRQAFESEKGLIAEKYEVKLVSERLKHEEKLKQLQDGAERKLQETRDSLSEELRQTRDAYSKELESTSGKLNEDLKEAIAQKNREISEQASRHSQEIYELKSRHELQLKEKVDAFQTETYRLEAQLEESRLLAEKSQSDLERISSELSELKEDSAARFELYEQFKALPPDSAARKSLSAFIKPITYETFILTCGDLDNIKKMYEHMSERVINKQTSELEFLDNLLQYSIDLCAKSFPLSGLKRLKPQVGANYDGSTQEKTTDAPYGKISKVLLNGFVTKRDKSCKSIVEVT
ncbi:MAG: hypothetical protein LBU32_08665 [Clostridiales bacterium]|jgi:DNA repair exonuclease SbcCD ATPase subunit|nr:hypothetical protein [Clostridiales bacterium]